MISKEMEVKSATGIYARSATLLVRKASQFKSEINIECKNKIANAKSLINILSLAIFAKQTIKISVSGVDEELALNEMIKLIDSLE